MSSRALLSYLVLLAAFASGLAYVGHPRMLASSSLDTCPLEIKLCPDGTIVGRGGPDCAFARCLGASGTPEDSSGDATSSKEDFPPYRSGIRGVVMKGPACPVEAEPPAPPCADSPYRTTVVVFDASDKTRVLDSVQTDAAGTFEFSLPPGRYVLGAGEGAFPRCGRPEIEITPGTYATAIVSCDTGIR